MATTTESTGTIIQSWVPVQLAAELKDRAADERRSVSALIRMTLEDALRDEEAE